MATTIAIINREETIEKSLTAVNLAAGLAREGQKTLLIDMDPQANATSSYGISSKDWEQRNTYHIIMGLSAIQEILCSTKIPNLSIIPSHLNLTQAESELAQVTDRESKLRAALSAIQDDYAFIIIECPVSLGLLSLNAFVAAQSVLIPLSDKATYPSRTSDQLFDTLQFMRRQLNPQVRITGVSLSTSYPLSSNPVDEFPDFPHRLYETRINHSDPKDPTDLLCDFHSPAGQSYLHLAREIIRKTDPGS